VVKVGVAHLAGRVAEVRGGRVAREHGHGARVRRAADVVGGGAGGGDGADERVRAVVVDEDGLGEWGAADVAEADEEDGGACWGGGVEVGLRGGHWTEIEFCLV